MSEKNTSNLLAFVPNVSLHWGWFDGIEIVSVPLRSLGSPTIRVKSEKSLLNASVCSTGDGDDFKDRRYRNDEELLKKLSKVQDVRIN